MNSLDQSQSNSLSSSFDSKRQLDDKLMELQALFDISKTLNASLNLKFILDNILLTPMGKMMISKGLVLLHKGDGIFVVETLKGLPRTLIGKHIEIRASLLLPTFTYEIKEQDNGWCDFFKQFGIVLLLPLVSNNRNLGLIGFGGKILGNDYTPSELDFLNSLSNLAATSVENGLIFRELHDINRKLDKKIQELNTLFDIGKELNATLDSDKIVNLLAYAIMGEMMVNRCLVFLKKNDAMELAVAKGITRVEDELKKLREEKFLKYLCQLYHPINLDLESEPDDLRPLNGAGFKIVVPMKVQDETKGIIAVGDKINRQSFREDELEFLYTLGNQAMISLENARLFEETLEKQRLEEELAIAREIQQRLLPEACPTMNGFEIAAINVPSRQIGGDYYDCIKIDETHYGLAIADVSGKGTPASLLMANLQASLHALVSLNLPLSQIVAKINHLIYENTSQDKFITFCYGILDIENKTFTYSNAGHNPPYLFHANNTFQTLEKGGLLLGMMPGMLYQEETVQLKRGDWLIMFTDGVTEAMNEKDEEFTEVRLKQIIKEHAHLSASEMIDAIYIAVKSFLQGTPPGDDITMLCVKVL